MGERILLVEDEKIVRELILDFLREQEHTCDEVADGPQAIELLRSRSYDLLLTDINLPNLDGLRVIEHANKLAPDMPKIIISANHEIEVALNALRLGAYDFVRKPLRQLEELGVVVERALEHRRLILRQRESEKMIARMNSQLTELNARLEDEVHRRTEDLIRANHELRTLDEMKNNLLSNVSHELRTPLVSVRGYTELFASGHLCDVPDDCKKYLVTCLKNIDRLLSLINSLVHYAETVRNGVSLDLKAVDLGRVAGDITQEYCEDAKKRGVKLELILPENPVLAHIDHKLFVEAVRNLLSNAIKFNHEGGTVSLSIDPIGRNLVNIGVRDTGIGIPDEFHAKIFERFWQVDSSPTRRHGGTGIGLAIARDNLRLLGCELRVSSKVGKGSTFYFTMPTLKEGQVDENNSN